MNKVHSETQEAIELGRLDAQIWTEGRQRCLDAGGCPECFCVPSKERQHWPHCSQACRAMVLYDSRFLRFDWGTVADAAEVAMLNECRRLNTRMKETTAMVREAIRELAA